MSMRHSWPRARLGEGLKALAPFTDKILPNGKSCNRVSVLCDALSLCFPMFPEQPFCMNVDVCTIP